MPGTLHDSAYILDGLLENQTSLEPKELMRRRCQGASMMSLAREFSISSSTVHGYIEDVRKQLREQTINLAAQEIEQSLALIDSAIEVVMPHIREGELLKIQTIKQGRRGPVVISVKEYEARMKGCEVLVKLIDRKAKLLGLDAPAKSEDVSPPKPPPTPEEVQRGMELLASVLSRK